MLTQPRGGLLTIGAVLALYFSSSGIEALRTGLNRAYDALDHAAVVAAAAAIHPVHDGRLVRPAGARLFRGARAADLGARCSISRRNLRRCSSSSPSRGSGSRRSSLCLTLFVAHIWLPAVKLRFVDVAPGVILTFVGSVGFGETVRLLPQRVRAQLRLDLRGPRLGDDHAGVPLFGGGDLRVRRRTQRGDPARRATREGAGAPGGAGARRRGEPSGAAGVRPCWQLIASVDQRRAAVRPPSQTFPRGSGAVARILRCGPSGRDVAANVGASCSPTTARRIRRSCTSVWTRP